MSPALDPLSMVMFPISKGCSVSPSQEVSNTNKVANVEHLRNGGLVAKENAYVLVERMSGPQVLVYYR